MIDHLLPRQSILLRSSAIPTGLSSIDLPADGGSGAKERTIEIISGAFS